MIDGAFILNAPSCRFLSPVTLVSEKGACTVKQRQSNYAVFYICGAVHHHLINKDDQRDAAGSICLYYACGITLHVSGAPCTHHQECIETVNADSVTIVYSFYTPLMMGARSTRNM